MRLRYIGSHIVRDFLRKDHEDILIYDFTKGWAEVESRVRIKQHFGIKKMIAAYNELWRESL